MRKKLKNKKDSILSRAKEIGELSLTITALFYGRSGSGKTTLLGTFPKPLLLLDIGEKGTDSLSTSEDIKVLEIKSWSEFEEVYWELKDGDSEYLSIGIDAIHSLQDLAILEAKSKVKKNADDPTSKRDFGIASGLMKQWIFNYRDLSEECLNIVFIAHERVTEGDDDDDDGMLVPEVGPRLMPSVASTLTGAVNLVGHTFIRESIAKLKLAGRKLPRTVDYCLRVGPHGYYTTKIRSPKEIEVPDFIIDPDYDKLVQTIKGSKKSIKKRHRR